MKEFIKALVSKNKSNIVPAEHNLFGHFVGEWDFEWIDCYGTAEERHIKGEWIFQWILEGTAIQDVFICPSRKERLTRWHRPASTITTKFYSISNGRFGHPEEDRALSLREGATLQTFPKTYVFKTNSIAATAKLIGNAVPCEYARRLGETIKALENNGTI